MKLTGNQIEEIGKLQKYLKERLKGLEAVPENTAAIMEELCENLDYNEALSICRGIWQGAEEMYRLCTDISALIEPDFIETMLGQMTEGMAKEQRKGFFLQSLDAFCKNQSSEEDTAFRAALPEDELKALLAERIRDFSESALRQMGETSGEPCFWVQSGNSLEKLQITKEDAFLFAAAEYVAGLNGVLSHEFGEYPELLGISAAAQMIIAKQSEEFEEGAEEEQAELLLGILYAAVGAALAISVAAVGAAVSSVFLAIESSALGVVLSVFVSMTLYFLLIMNCLMAIGAVTAVVHACMERILRSQGQKENREAEAVHRIAETDHFPDTWEENQETSSNEEAIV